MLERLDVYIIKSSGTYPFFNTDIFLPYMMDGTSPTQ